MDKKSSRTGSWGLEEVNQCKQKKPLMVLPAFSSVPTRTETIAQLSTVLAAPQGSQGTSIIHTACQCLLYSTLPLSGWTPVFPLLSPIPSWHFSAEMLSRDSINWDWSICASRGCWSLLYSGVWAHLSRGCIVLYIHKYGSSCSYYMLVISGYVYPKCRTVFHGQGLILWLYCLSCLLRHV